MAPDHFQRMHTYLRTGYRNSPCGCRLPSTRRISRSFTSAPPGRLLPPLDDLRQIVPRLRMRHLLGEEARLPCPLVPVPRFLIVVLHRVALAEGCETQTQP